MNVYLYVLDLSHMYSVDAYNPVSQFFFAV